MKLIKTLTLVLLLIPIAFALGTQVSTGTYFEGDSFVIDNKLYTIDKIYQYPTYSEVSIYHDQGYLTIRNKTYEKTANYQFYHDTTTYDTSRKERKSIIKAYRRSPDATITRSTSVSEMWVGAEATITATITNEGDKDGYFTYVDIFSRDINITDVDNCDEDPYYLKWNINNTWMPGKNIVCGEKIKINKTKTITYDITPTEVIDESYRALVTYFNGYENITEESGSVVIKSKYFFEIDSMFSNNHSYRYSTTELGSSDDYTKFQLGQDIYFFTELRNDFPSPIEIESIKFKLSDGLEFKGNHYLHKYINTTKTLYQGQNIKEIAKNTYEYQGSVNTSRFFGMNLLPTKAGKQIINIEVNVLNKNKSFDNQVRQTYSTYNEVTINNKDIEIQTNFEGESFDSGETYTLKFQVNNPNSHSDLKNINIKIDSDLIPNRTINLDTLTKEEVYNQIIHEDIIMPIIDSDKTYKANFNISYQDQFNTKKQEYITINLPVKKIPDLTITKTFSPTTIYEGEDIEVTTKVKNNRYIDLPGVIIEEQFDPNLKIQQNISKSSDLNQQTTHQVYTYKFKAPEVKEDTKFYINTTTFYIRNNINYTSQKQKEFTVKNKILKPTVTKEIEGTAVYGNILHITYKIKNTEDEAIYNIQVNYPLQEETDLIDKTFYWINKLQPDEEIILNHEEKIRIKNNATFKLVATNITFEDKDKIQYSKTTSTISITPIIGSLNDAAIIINKTAPAQVNLSEPFTTTTNIKNIGTDTAEVSINNQVLTITPNTVKSITQTLTLDQVETKTLDKTIASYKVNDLIYYTATNQPSVKVINNSEEITIKEKEQETEPKETKPESEIITKEETIKSKKTTLVIVAIIIVAFLLFLMVRPMKPRKLEFSK
jgi:hypothetical protein